MVRPHCRWRSSGVKRAVALISLLFVLGASLFSYSCSKREGGHEASRKESGEHGMAPDWRFSLPKGDPVEGREIFVAVECYKCHEVKGEKFPQVAEREKGVGPELSQMAWMHPVEFFAESIVNPNAVIDASDKAKGYLGEDGKSKMPDYNNILTVKQVADLAAYLASLKGPMHAGR